MRGAGSVEGKGEGRKIGRVSLPATHHQVKGRTRGPCWSYGAPEKKRRAE